MTVTQWESCPGGSCQSWRYPGRNFSIQVLDAVMGGISIYIEYLYILYIYILEYLYIYILWVEYGWNNIRFFSDGAVNIMTTR